MNLRKLFSGILAASLSFTCLTGCGAQNKPAASAGASASAEKPTITFWTKGSQNISDMFTTLVEEYNKRPESTAKVDFQFILSGTGDEGLAPRMAAAFKTNQKDSGFDLIAENTIELSGYTDSAGSEDLFLPIDFSKIPNYKNVLVKPAAFADKVVPYRGTTVVMAYDSERLPNPPKTWVELLQYTKDHPGRFAYSSSGGAAEAFIMTASYKDMPEDSRASNDTKWTGEWDKGFNLLKELHPNLYRSGGNVVYPNKNQGSIDLLANKEVDLIPAWADQILTNISKGILPKTTKIYNFTDAPLSGTDVAFAIPSIGKNPEACYDFINFVISPEGQKICMDSIYAIPVIDASSIQSEASAMVKDLDMSKFKILSIGDLKQKYMERWDREIATLK